MAETPPWMNEEIKQLIEQKNQSYKRFIRSNKILLYINQFKALQDELSFWLRNQKIVIIQSCLRSYLIKLLALKLTGQYWKHF